MTGPAVSLVMPAFNSVRYVDDNVGRVLAFFDAAGIDGEVVVADDGRTDGTADSIRADPRSRSCACRTAARGPRCGPECGRDRRDPGLHRRGPAVRAGATAAGDALIRERHYHAVIGDRTLPGSGYENTGLLRTCSGDRQLRLPDARDRRHLRHPMRVQGVSWRRCGRTVPAGPDRRLRDRRGADLSAAQVPPRPEADPSPPRAQRAEPVRVVQDSTRASATSRPSAGTAQPAATGRRSWPRCSRRSFEPTWRRSGLRRPDLRPPRADARAPVPGRRRPGRRCLGSRWFRFETAAHRWATAFLIELSSRLAVVPDRAAAGRRPGRLLVADAAAGAVLLGVVVRSRMRDRRGAAGRTWWPESRGPVDSGTRRQSERSRCSSAG